LPRGSFTFLMQEKTGEAYDGDISMCEALLTRMIWVYVASPHTLVVPSKEMTVPEFSCIG
jgi:hypothetical protein